MNGPEAARQIASIAPRTVMIMFKKLKTVASESDGPGSLLNQPARDLEHSETAGPAINSSRTTLSICS